MTKRKDIEAFRRFNRMYTRVLGVLDEGFLTSQFTLAEGRLLYELATRPSSRMKDLAEDLRLDQGYISRLVKRFEEAGLLVKEISREDGRSADLALTDAGKTVFQGLNKLSDDQAVILLADHSAEDVEEMLSAMRTIERFFGSDSEEPFTIRTHRIGDMGWIVHKEAIGYSNQFGWNESIEALEAKIVSDFLTNFNAKKERCWIAEIGTRHAGHVFLVQQSDDLEAAKLRLLYVEPFARGKGIGEALVQECVKFAREVGYRRIDLWTQSILTSAHKIYRKAGFTLRSEEKHSSFGPELVGQVWSLEL